MSMIGPRPLLFKYLPLYSKEQKRRHEIKPGITGLAQVNGRNAISWTKKFEYDVYYVDHLSLFLDFKIMFKTITSYRFIKFLICSKVKSSLRSAYFQLFVSVLHC